MSPGSRGRETFQPPIAFESLDRTPFQDLPEAARSAELFLADALVDAVVDGWCLRVIRDLGVPSLLPETREALGLRAGVAPEQLGRFDWILSRLAAARLLEIDDEGRVAGVGPDRWSAEILAEARRSLEDRVGSTFELLDEVGEATAAGLLGQGPEPALFAGREALDRWERYFTNDNVTYAAINRMVAHVASAVPGSRLRILEVGGGLGSAAEALLESLGERVGLYRFTEISPALLVRGRDRIRQRFPDVELDARRLDLNRGLAEQGIEGSGHDLVLGVNTLHVVRNLSASLTELRQALRPGGTLILGEGVRPRSHHPVAIEFVFQWTREFQEVDPESFRPAGGFLDPAQWRAALEANGFVEVSFVPDFDRAVAAHPTYSLAAITARRGETS